MDKWRRTATWLALLGALTLAVTGCGWFGGASGSGSAGKAANNAGSNSAAASNGIGQTGKAALTGTSGIGNGVLNAGAASSGGINTDSSSVVAGIQAAPAHMLNTYSARVNGRPFAFGMSSVKFVSKAVGYLAGDGIILKTTDGGNRFFTVYRSGAKFRAITTAHASSQVVVAWAPASIVVSLNGGAKWYTAATPALGSGASVQQVDFVTASVGYAITGDNWNSGTLWQTTNGGHSWTRLRAPAAALSVSFGSTSTGWLGAISGDIYETTDGGARWSRVFAPGVNYPSRPEVEAVNNHAAWALMIGGSGMSQTSYAVFRTSNGSTWSPVLGVSTAGAGPAPDGATSAAKGPGSSPGPMAALSPDSAVVTGTCEACGMGGGQVASTGDGGLSWSTAPMIPNAMSMPSSVSFISRQVGWVLDAVPNGGSVLLQTNDGGSTWHEVYPMVHPTPVEGVSFLSTSVGFGLGVPGNADAVLKTTDGGHTWNEVGSLPVNNTNQAVSATGVSPIDFVSTAVGFAVGPDGAVYETKDGGSSWQQSLPAGAQNLYASVAFVDNGKYGLAIGDGATAQVTVDGGRTWYPFNIPVDGGGNATAELYLAGLANLPVAPTLKSLVSSDTPEWVAIHSGRVAMVPAQNGQSFFVTANGGQQWRNVFFGSRYPNPVSVDFVNAEDGWLITVNGSLLRTTDGGQIWTYASH